VLPAKSASWADSFTLMGLKNRKNSRTDFSVILSSYLEVWNFMEPQDVLLPQVTSRGQGRALDGYAVTASFAWAKRMRVPL